MDAVSSPPVLPASAPRRGSAWESFDFATPLPSGFAAPPHHWPGFQRIDLKGDIAVALNHLGMRYSCQMLVYFEMFLIAWMERHFDVVARAVPAEDVRRMIEEERLHARAFQRLAARFGEDESRPTPLAWSRLDGWLVEHAPVVTLIAVVALFEEMTIPVADVIEEDPTAADPLTREVMRLHALDERGHVGLNLRILKAEAARTPAWRFVPLLFLSLPIMRYVDVKMARAWARLVVPFARAHGLDRGQERAIINRGLSRSDALGIASFLVKHEKTRLPGGALYRHIIELATRAPARLALAGLAQRPA